MKNFIKTTVYLCGISVAAGLSGALSYVICDKLVDAYDTYQAKKEGMEAAKKSLDEDHQFMI